MKNWLVLLATTSGLLGCAEEKASVFLDAATPTGSTAAKDAGPADAGTARDGGKDAARPPSRSEPKVLNLGEPCVDDSDCEGDAPKCATRILAGGVLPVTYPGGYCTATCAEDADCGDDGSCPGAAQAALDPESSLCALKCDLSDEDACRKGYTCMKPPYVMTQQTSCLPPFGTSPAPEGNEPEEDEEADAGGRGVIEMDASTRPPIGTGTGNDASAPGRDAGAPSRDAGRF